MRADVLHHVYADYDQQKIYHDSQPKTAEVVKTEVKSESSVYSYWIKIIYKEVLNLQLTSENNNEEEVLETKYGKFGFQESMRNNIFTLAGAIKDQAMTFICLPYLRLV